MEYESKRTLEDLIPMLTRLDQGAKPTSAEQAELEAVEVVDATRYAGILPRSMKKLINLNCLQLRNAAIDDLSPLSELHNLQNLDLANTQVTNLIPLAKLYNLKSLVFSGTQVNDISPLARLYSLQSLDLSYTQIIDVSPLARLSSLKSLNLSCTLVNDLSSLTELHNLQTLRLWRTNIYDISPIAALDNLRYLRLTDTQVNSLIPLSGLCNLQYLNLRGTKINDISPLSGLNNLQSLNLYGTQIYDFSPLSMLQSLQSLDLQNTPISNLTPLSGLHNLQSLNLQRTQVRDLSSLNELHNLKYLRLSDTRVDSLLPLAKLYKLQTLELQNTRVNDLSPLTKLRKLHYLDLKHTYARDITPLNGLRKLKKLGLSGLELRAIPRAFFNLNLPFIFDHVSDKKYYIELIDSTISTQPVSLFQQERKVIRAYYDAEHVDIREAKVIFLGDGGAGKTHTIQRILNEDKDEDINTHSTLGISITSYQAKGELCDFRINFWDFGGQENMHAMHRCFLTERTCYVVVISNRWNLDTQARYWLDNIYSFAPKAPVILAVNKWDGFPACPMDTNRLYRDYPNLEDVTLYTAKGGKTDDFTSHLTRFIIRHAEELDSNTMRLPKDWAAIRQDLVNMADKNEWYINQDDYYQICDAHGLGRKENAAIRTWLLDWFNDLGICFSHHAEQSKYNVLNPRWLTSAIYILLNSRSEYSTNGIIDAGNLKTLLEEPSWDKLYIRDIRDDIPDYILSEDGYDFKTGKRIQRPLSYNKEERQHILAVMRKFELSYPLSDGREFIPALCNSVMPENLYPTEYQAQVSYAFRYSFLPDSVVQRLMVRLCPRPYTALWRKGFRFEETNLTTVVDTSGPNDTLRIDVFTQASRSGKDTVMMLVAQIRDLHRAMGITAEEFIVVHGPRGEIPVPADMVLLAWDRNIPQLHLYSKENGLIAESPSKILGEAYSPEILDKAKELAQQHRCTASEAASTVVHNHYHDKVINIEGDVINGDTIEGDKIEGNYNNHVIPENLITVLGKLIEQNCQNNQSFVDHLLKQLEESESEDTRKIAKEAKSDPQKKKNILNILLSTVGGVTSFLADSPSAKETITAIADAVTSAINLYGPKFAEFISNLPPIFPPL